MTLYALFTIIGIIAAILVAKFIDIPKQSKKFNLDAWMCGAAGLILGAKLPVWVLYGFSLQTVLTGKSVMGGLLGVFIAINAYKFFTRQQAQAFGGRFTIPFAVALGFGKIGCYFNGCCGGDFFVPVQLIESVFQFAVALALYVFYKKTKRADLLFPIYLLSYLIIRFSAEFVRDGNPSIALGLNFYQLIAICFAPIAIFIIYKRTLETEI